MGLLGQLGNGQGYLKAGFLGFGGTGKSYTATLLAIGTRKHFKLDGPIALYDTENGSEYLAPMIEKATGKPPVGIKTRSFDDLVAMGKECVTAGVSVLVVDSITHPWRELCDAYLGEVNARRKKNNQRALSKLEFNHWNAIKGPDLWGRWTDFFLNSPLHIVICGRAGYEYEMEQNEETGRKELNKTGIRMKTEGEFGFEPSLLVEMERIQTPDDAGGFRITRQAVVLKDRFGKIDGATHVNPTFGFFEPHVKLLKPGAHSVVDTSIKTATGADEDGDASWARERRTRQILCEEIEGELTAKWPGMTKEEKKGKADAVHAVFNTRSWTMVESMHSDKLREGLAMLRNMLHPTTQGAEVLCACPDGPGGVHLEGCNQQALAAEKKQEDAGIAF